MGQKLKRVKSQPNFRESQEYRGKLIEAISENDETMMNRYLAVKSLRLKK